MERMFPIFVKLQGRSVLVVGAGKIAESKIKGLLDTGAKVLVVALHASERVQQWAESGAISLEQRSFSPADLRGVLLVIGATASAAVNEVVFLEARARGVLCNVVDVPEQCDFFYPAVVHRGDLQIAISTAGQSPSLAQKLRHQLEKHFGPKYGDWVAELGETRREVLRSHLAPEQKKFLLRSLASREAFEALLAAHQTSGVKENAA